MRSVKDSPHATKGDAHARPAPLTYFSTKRDKENFDIAPSDICSHRVGENGAQNRRVLSRQLTVSLFSINNQIKKKAGYPACSVSCFALACSASAPRAAWVSGWIKPADMMSLAASSGVIGISMTSFAGRKK